MNTLADGLAIHPSALFLDPFLDLVYTIQAKSRFHPETSRPSVYPWIHRNTIPDPTDPHFNEI